MPAYNAARTLVRTLTATSPRASSTTSSWSTTCPGDDTVAVAELLNLQVVVHRQNLGYGGNQKTCYDTALAEGADVVVMVHPDYQYDATRIPELVAPIPAGDADMVLGSRFLGDLLAGGMPRWKFVANRFLTTLQNRAYALRLSEYHTGFRAYSRKLLETIDYRANSTTSCSTRSWSARSSGPASASPRSPSPPGISPRPAWSTSAARSSTACRPSAPWPTTAPPPGPADGAQAERSSRVQGWFSGSGTWATQRIDWPKRGWRRRSRRRFGGDDQGGRAGPGPGGAALAADPDGGPPGKAASRRLTGRMTSGARPAVSTASRRLSGCSGAGGRGPCRRRRPARVGAGTTSRTRPPGGWCGPWPGGRPRRRPCAPGR